MTMAFWNRTLKIFRAEPVKLRTRLGIDVVGDIDSIGDASCSIKKTDGSLVVVQFTDILICEPGVRKL